MVSCWSLAEHVCGVTGVLLSVSPSGCGVSLNVCAMVFSVSQCVACVHFLFPTKLLLSTQQLSHTRERMGLWF